MTDGAIRWGILGTAGIAESAFLPALGEAGDGVAAAVASRTLGRAQLWAGEHGVARGVEGYERIVLDPEVDAIYIPLPNALHAGWTVTALEAGKAVLCEKPLCATPDETSRVLTVARRTPGPLWEAFVFPFHEQIDRVLSLIAEGAVGDIREIVSRFHFRLDDPSDIRMLAELAGGSIQDVGCYPIRLARLLFNDEPELNGAIADAIWLEATGGETEGKDAGIDTELWGALRFPGDRRLLLSSGFLSQEDTSTRVLGTQGEIRMTNPFHPGPDDTLALVRDGVPDELFRAMPSGERSFTPAIRHIHRVLRGVEEPRHLALEDALGNAIAIEALLNAARS
jgi:predicted dehydrogenase